MANDMPVLWTILFCLLPVVCYAGSVETVDVSYHKGRYIIGLTAVLDARPDEVYRVITDYEHMDRLSDAFTGSRILGQTEDGRKRTLLLINACLLFFCFDSRMVQEVSEQDNLLVTSVVDASQSDFRYGTNRWRLVALPENRTKLIYNCEKEPAFWVPPVIGPWLIKHRMQTEMVEIIHRIEALAQNV